MTELTKATKDLIYFYNTGEVIVFRPEPSITGIDIKADKLTYLTTARHDISIFLRLHFLSNKFT